MAVVFATLTAAEIALAAADKPILAATPDPDFLTAGWVVGSTFGTIVSATDNDPDRPAIRAWDGLPGLQTQPDSDNTLFTFVMEHTKGIEFDFVGFLNHNFDTIDMTTLILQIADDTLFAVNFRELMNINPSALLSSDRRFADLSLFHTGSDPIRYSQVQFMRLRITLGSSGRPLIGQVVFGRRRQLKHEPNRPWDPTDLHSLGDAFESRGGSISVTPRYKGRREITANLNPDTSPTAAPSPHQQDLIDWYVQTEHGILPYVWIDKPDATPNDFFFMRRREPSLEYPFVTPFTREFTLDGLEQGPTFFSQDPS